MVQRLVGLAFALLLAVPLPSLAQGRAGDAGGPHRVAVELGGLWQGVDDRMATPLRYTGTGLALGVQYERRGDRWRWGLRAAGAMPRLSGPLYDADSGYAETSWLTGVGYLLGRVWRRPGRLTVWAGPGLAGEASRRRHTYVADGELDFDSGFLAVHLAGLAELELGRYGRLSETLAVPVAGLAVRKEYTGVEGRGPVVTLELPPSLLLVHHRLTYRLPGTDAVGAYLFHEGSLVRHTEPLELASISHRLGVAVQWTWGRR